MPSKKLEQYVIVRQPSVHIERAGSVVYLRPSGPIDDGYRKGAEAWVRQLPDVEEVVWEQEGITTDG